MSEHDTGATDLRHGPAAPAGLQRPRPGRGLPAYRPARSPLMSMGPSLEEERRRHRIARRVAIASVVVAVAAVVLVWAVGLLGREVVQRGVGGTGVAATSAVPVLPAGRPAPQTLASAIVEAGKPGLRLQLPIRREAVTGIGFAPRREPGVIELEPSGHRANLTWGRRVVERFLSTRPPGDLRWYRLADGAPSMGMVGAAPGTDAYAPLDARVVAISAHVVDGERRGVVVQLQPLGDGQTVVVLRNLDPAEGLAVGQTVSEGATRIGYVRDMEGVMEAPLATYTHDSGSALELFVIRAELPDTAF